MAGQEDSLRLAAEIVDKFSGPLREMTKSVHQFQDLLKHGHEASTKQAKEQAERQKELTERLIETGRGVRELVTPAFAAMGIGIYGVSESLGKMIDKFREAGESFYKIQGAMARTGMSGPELDAYSRTISKITGQSIDAAREQLSHLGDIARQLQRNYSPTVAALESTFNNLHPLINKMANESSAQAINDFMEYYESHPAPPDQRRKLLVAMGLDPNLADATTEQLRETLEKQQAWVKANPDLSLKERLDLREGFEKLDDAIDKFERKMEHAFGGPAVKLVEGLADALNSIVDKIAIIRGEKDAPEMLPNKIWEQSPWSKLSDPSEFIKRMDETHPWLQGLDDVFKSGGVAAGAASPELSFENRWSGLKTGPGKKPAPTPGGVEDRWQGLYHPSAFTTGGGDAETTLSRGVKTGTLAALREWFAEAQSAAGDGFRNAAYTPEGAPKGSGFRSGGGYSVLPNDAPGKAGAGGGGASSDLGGAAPGGGGPTGIAGGGINRDKWLEQLNANPALKEELYRRSLGENTDPMANQAVMEEAANRADIRGNRRFDEHSNLSYFQGYHTGNLSKYRKMLDENFDKVFRQGSDISGGAIDNSSQGLAWVHEHGGQMGQYGRPGLPPGRFRTTANFGGDRITGHRGVESFEVPGWGESGSGERERWPAWRQHQLAEAAERRDLLATAQKAGIGGGVQKVEGDASLNVAFENAPAGAKAYMKYGGMFKSAKVDWGHPMSPSDPGN